MTEIVAITEVVEMVGRYYQALYVCDVEEVKAIFDPSTRIRGYYEGELINQSLPQYLKLLATLSTPEMIGEKVDAQIVSINVIGDAAIIQTKYVFESLNYTDFLSLLKVNNQWQIVSKLFHHD